MTKPVTIALQLCGLVLVVVGLMYLVNEGSWGALVSGICLLAIGGMGARWRLKAETKRSEHA